MPTLIHEKLKSLRDDRGLSASRLSMKAGVGEKTIQAIEAARGRVPEAAIIEALADALEVAPDDFYEYPIAVARRDGRLARRATMPEIRRRAAAARAKGGS